MFTTEIEGEAELVSAFGSAANLISQGASRGVMLGVSEGAAEARTNHSFKNCTGTLEASIVGQALGWTAGGTRYEGVIRATAKYASYVDEGTPPHIIAPRMGTWLHWEPEQGDHHFARVVHHPGTKGLPFMFLAYYKAERVIVRELEIAVRSAQQLFN